MRGPEIISSITWHPDTDPDTRARIEQAILNFDRLAHGNGQPILHPLEADMRLRKFVHRHGTATAAAAALGIGKGTLYDMQVGRRKLSPRVQAALGVRRVPAQPERYEEI